MIVIIINQMMVLLMLFLMVRINNLVYIETIANLIVAK